MKTRSTVIGKGIWIFILPFDAISNWRLKWEVLLNTEKLNHIKQHLVHKHNLWYEQTLALSQDVCGCCDRFTYPCHINQTLRVTFYFLCFIKFLSVIFCSFTEFNSNRNVTGKNISESPKWNVKGGHNPCIKLRYYIAKKNKKWTCVK